MSSSCSVEHEDARDENITTLRDQLVEHLKENGSLQSGSIETAFRAVPRHLFLPGHAVEDVYSDQAVLTKMDGHRAISSSSQPSIMAIMLEQLDLCRGQRVLEIGAGTGFNAALIAEIVGEEGEVVTIDIDKDIASQARQNLAAAGFERVKVVCADGKQGYAAGALYDRIVLTVGGWEISPDWLEQLLPEGRLLLPLSVNGPQLSVAFDRAGDHLISTSVVGCGFMRLRGELTEPQTSMVLAEDPAVFLEWNDELPGIDAEIVFQWINGPYQEWPTGIIVTTAEVWSSLALWQALRVGTHGLLVAHGREAVKSVIPFLFGRDGSHWFRMTAAAVGETGISLLVHPLGEGVPLEAVSDQGQAPSPFELHVRSYGPADTTARVMVEGIKSWHEAGRPGHDGLRIRVYPSSRDYAPTESEHVLRRRWHDFVLDWPIAGSNHS